MELKMSFERYAFRVEKLRSAGLPLTLTVSTGHD
jgi:hypothetical protein